ncbi:MAG: hypothetical protein Q4P07_02070 [Ornithinimicrobium sp.]|nr:hypothetical protein [Ornithinimicrobium sp.]MDO5738916.1 hypothetical protein [Ornithinimicrobium sp.]
MTRRRQDDVIAVVACRILDGRYARGEIDEQDYLERPPRLGEPDL